MIIHDMVVGEYVARVHGNRVEDDLLCEVFTTAGESVDSFLVYRNTHDILSLLKRHFGTATGKDVELLAEYFDRHISGPPYDDDFWFSMLPYMEKANAITVDWHQAECDDEDE